MARPQSPRQPLLGFVAIAVFGIVTVAMTPTLAQAQILQYLMMPDSASANYRMVLFDPFNGSLVNSNYFPLNGVPTSSTPIHALQVGNEIWVSEQVGDRVARYDLTGTYLGQIGGGTSGGLDNIRGMGLIGNTVYVTNAGTANGAPGAAVVMYDTTGAPLGNFLTPNASSPFGILAHQGAMLVSSSNANDDIHRYSLTGTSLGTFHNSTSLNFVEQMNYATNGDVLAAGFSSNNVVRLDPNTGSLISSFTASGARGVYQLGNGNIMWTSGAGVFVYDVIAGTSTNVYATTGGRYIDLLTVPEPSSVLLVGFSALAWRHWRRRQ